MSEPIGTDERLDRIEALTAQRDALREAVDEVTEYAKRHQAERDALNDRITMLEEERDALAEARDMMGRLWEKEKAERDALAEQLTETEAAMRKFLKNHDALAKRLARRGSTRRAHRMGGG